MIPACPDVAYNNCSFVWAMPYRTSDLCRVKSGSCHALLISTGVSYRTLDVLDVERLAGAGVYYGAAIAEALACQGRDVFIVGAGNSAGQAAVYLSTYASSVTMLVRGGSLAQSMSHYLVSQLESHEKITVSLRSTVAGVKGDTRLEEIVIADVATGDVRAMPAFAFFIIIGSKLSTTGQGSHPRFSDASLTPSLRLRALALARVWACTSPTISSPTSITARSLLDRERHASE
jgi:hypothetical protein